jgi:hypothetical protein
MEEPPTRWPAHLLVGIRGQGRPEAIGERRAAPLMPGGGVRMLFDRVGGSKVSGGSCDLRDSGISKRKLFLALGAVCLLVGVVTFEAAQRWPSQGWTFGMLAGGMFAIFMIARMSPPGWIENRQTGHGVRSPLQRRFESLRVRVGS